MIITLYILRIVKTIKIIMILKLCKLQLTTFLISTGIYKFKLIILPFYSLVTYIARMSLDLYNNINGLDHGASWVRIPSGARIFSEFPLDAKI